MTRDFEDLRREYDLAGLAESDLDACPAEQFRRWFDQALEAGLYLPDAMTLATRDKQGAPNARVVVLRGVEEGALLFYTSYASEKGDELEAEPRAVLLFHWNDLERQVRIRGRVEKTTPEESARYFAKRPRESQIAAWASPQSRPIADRAELEAAFDEAERLHEGKPVPTPSDWGGYRLRPDAWEFWQGRARRLHDRLRYLREGGGGWRIERLAP